MMNREMRRKNKCVIEIHVGKRYGVTRINTEENGGVKYVTINNVKHYRISSQAKRYSIRDEFKRWEEERIQGHTMARSRFIKNWIQKMILESDQYSELHKKYAGIIAGIIVDGIIGAEVSDDKTKNILLVTEFDARFLTDVMVKELDNEEKCEKAKECYEFILKYRKMSKTDKADKENKKKSEEYSEFVKKCKDKAKNISVMCGLECSIFGRMVTSEVLYNVESAIYMNHSISIGAAASDMDYYTAVDSLLASGIVQLDSPSGGAGYLDNKEFGSNVYYEYASIDVGQFIKNFMHHKSEISMDDYDLIFDALTMLIRYMVLIPPIGAQHSFASFPDPVGVHITVHTSGSNRTADRQVIEMMGGSKYETEEEKMKKALASFIFSDFSSPEERDKRFYVGENEYIFKVNEKLAEEYGIKKTNLSNAIQETVAFAREVFLHE